MTAARPAAALFGGVALLERAVSYTLGQLQAVTPAALSRSTPCQRWDLRALLVHMDDSLATMREALDLRYVRPDPGASPGPGPGPGPGAGAGTARGEGGSAAGLVAALQSQACQLLAALAGRDEYLVWVGGYPLPVRIVTSAGAIDVAVHGWDVGRACGGDGSIPEQLARDMLQVAGLLVTGADRPGRFAAPVTVPLDASASDCLVGYLGRDPGWPGRTELWLR